MSAKIMVNKTSTAASRVRGANDLACFLNRSPAVPEWSFTNAALIKQLKPARRKQAKDAAGVKVQKLLYPMIFGYDADETGISVRMPPIVARIVKTSIIL